MYAKEKILRYELFEKLRILWRFVKFWVKITEERVKIIQIKLKFHLDLSINSQTSNQLHQPTSTDSTVNEIFKQIGRYYLFISQPLRAKLDSF